MSSSLTCTKLTFFTLAAIVIQIIGISLFVLGFFPVKPALSGVSGPESFRFPGCNSNEDKNVTNVSPDELKLLYQELSEIPPSFDRLVLMVIDGLPAEFVLGKDAQTPSKALKEAMPYTQSLLANGKAIGYHAKAAPPTVTMPRLKAMVSGAIGGFLDVAFNFNTQALLDDNLIGQFLRIGWKMVMLGDETWLKLFPGLFARHDGVSSFYVKDTVQVDHNVSRHLRDELSRTDWNVLILHYLGLDHVGHIGGRNSVLMGPKLKEMDEVVEMIHSSAIQPQDNNQGRTLLMIVSDHGMTENGNHGGSSYEETDSLALFIGLKSHLYKYTTHKTVYQVDIAPTLSLLYGVPIPKTSVGVLIPETFDSLTDYQKLRALELNSWQLLRLLQVQLPGLSCGSSLYEELGDDQRSEFTNCYGNVEEMLCCLYLNAAALHRSWKSKKITRSSSRDDYSSIISAYYDFLRAASDWLSHRATDKPFSLLACGLAAMVLSCLVLLGLLFCFSQDFVREKHRDSDLNNNVRKWHLDETIIIVIILILILSMGSSSMVEEEQYVWHFSTSTLYFVLLRKTLNSLTLRTGQIRKIYTQTCPIILVLTCGRILRGWHQGGVNWNYLPDISKWLEQEGSDYLIEIQLISGILVISLSLYALSLLQLKREFIVLIGFISLIPGLLVLYHIMVYQESGFMGSSYAATLLAQIIYGILGIFATGIIISLPWLVPIQNPTFTESNFIHVGIRDSIYVIGWGYIFCWCLLQLLLQQPVNSMPILLLFVQILASMWYSSSSDLHNKQWLEVAAMYYLGMAGHFALGNTNTLATIDVAGAYIGLSSHSTLLSGILMFIITYASPMLALLSLVMYISMKETSSLANPQDVDFGHLLKRTLGYPCLVPLCVNSVLLTAYTIMLLLMRNHLFVWSVFSPKYMYVCAATACVYLGISVVGLTVMYTCSVFSLRRMIRDSTRNDSTVPIN